MSDNARTQNIPSPIAAPRSLGSRRVRRGSRSLPAPAANGKQVIRHRFDFGSAHYHYNIYRDFPPDVLEQLEQARREYIAIGRAQASGAFPSHNPDAGLLERRICQMLLDETSLSPTEDRIAPLPTMVTRVAIDHLLSAILPQGSSVALSLPNWHFWEKLGGYQRGEYSFAFFDAINEEQFVSGFANVASRQDVRALIMASPTVPLMHTFSEAALNEVDRIALRENVAIIIDDVLRGVQPIGERDSIARYFTNPFVVEGFSKRFGDNPLGQLSYILLPPGSQDGSGAMHPVFWNDASFLRKVLDAAFQYSSTPAIEELRRRNKAFRRNLGPLPEEVRLIQSSPTHITSLLDIPPGPGKETHGFCNLVKSRRIAVSCIEAFYPPGYSVPRDIHGKVANEYRVTVGLMPRRKISRGAKALGEVIRAYYRQ